MSLNRPIWKLRDWIDIEKIDWNYLSFNENAIKLLENHQDKINWKYLSLNDNAIKLLSNNKNKINWKNLSSN